MTFDPRLYDPFPPPAPPGKATAGHASFVETYLARACAWLAGHNERHRQRRRLRTLDDRMLADIGLSSADVRSETAKCPWQL